MHPIVQFLLWIILHQNKWQNLCLESQYYWGISDVIKKPKCCLLTLSGMLFYCSSQNKTNILIYMYKVTYINTYKAYKGTWKYMKYSHFKIHVICIL